MIKINDSFVLRKIYERNILVPICANNAGNDPILLNSVACDIWKSAQNGISKDNLINEVLSIYGLSSDSVEAISINNFIDNMLEIGLLLEC